MNKHLNIYKTYTKVNRENYQLEDDLTRALAIVLQENDVLLHQFLKYILNQKENAYSNLFDDYTNKNPIEIDIQKPVESIEGFDHLFAVRISGNAMGNDFHNQNHDKDYNAITDLFIQIDNIAIIFEVKPNNHNSTAQLYNQALNTIKSDESLTMQTDVTAVDFNWSLIMQMAVRVNNYQVAINKESRLLDNFISYIKMHNYQWLPQLSLSALSFTENSNSISKRLNDAIENSDNTTINNRLGIKCNFGWAEEIVIYLNQKTEEVRFSVYPGNTKAQGYHIFKSEGEPQFKKMLHIKNKDRKINKNYHIKFSGQSYITGLWAGEKDFEKPLYTKANFYNHSGRKKRILHWEIIKNLLDNAFNDAYNWKEYCKWDEKLIDSNRSQFDISFGYELSISIPFKELQILDTDKNDLTSLIHLINEVKEAFKTVLIK
ncbi:hypothetical protein [Cellulophaga sp. HaHa_2_1]|uniref:hypothetical protein n=1 Tax=Cellulophaga sp. HaHa_2_1 TaxID=2749994 RepID=UPI001C4FE5A1|nr:hypothetical protein [Cellulophaga sp. HaHa_2_1]QXP53808.1 hypothetical protein H0I24_07720 [Cellulophaga sp. HaHa_2_1]